MYGRPCVSHLIVVRTLFDARSFSVAAPTIWNCQLSKCVPSLAPSSVTRGLPANLAASFHASDLPLADRRARLEIIFLYSRTYLPSVLWRCWLGGRKGIRPVKNLSGGVLAWVLGPVGRGADLHMAQLMPLPLAMSCSSKSNLVVPSWFYFSGTGSPG